MRRPLGNTLIHSKGTLEATHYVENGVLVETPLTIDTFRNGVRMLEERFPSEWPCQDERKIWFGTFVDMGMTNRMFESCVDYLTESFTYCCPIAFPSLRMVYEAMSHIRKP